MLSKTTKPTQLEILIKKAQKQLDQELEKVVKNKNKTKAV